MRRFILLAAFGLVVDSGGAAWAQSKVPGGWSNQVGYQSFGGVAPGGVAGATYNPFVGNPYGYGFNGSPAVVAPLPATAAYQQPFVPVPQARVVNNLDPLAGVIRRSTMTRRRR